MKLIRTRVQNFRSVVDSGEIAIEEGVTVLIGKNEQGKTNFLRGLASFNQAVKYIPRDFPNHLRAQLELRPPAEIPIIVAWFAPEPSELSELTRLLKKEQLSEQYRVTRFYDGHYEFHVAGAGPAFDLDFAPPEPTAAATELFSEAQDLKTRLTEHAKRSDAFKAAFDQMNNLVDAFVRAKFANASDLENLLSTFSTSLAALPGQDPPIQEEIAGAVRRMDAKQATILQSLAMDRRAQFMARLPTFLLHSSTTDRIPDEVNAADFVNNPEGTARGMASLCKLAGLTIAKIQELATSKDVGQRETYEDHFNAQIQGGINEFWTQAKYGVHFRLGESKLSVSISDNSYSKRIPPSQRSDGFQWYLSFYSTLLSESGGSAPTILLLDNPGLELHPDGQRDIKRFLEEKLPRHVQVAYVTHSPAMIDPWNLEQVRLVKRLQEPDGTKIDPWSEKDVGDADLLEPVRSALGASLVTSLMFNSYNILVEGAADRPIVEGGVKVICPPAETRSIQVNGPVSETPNGFLPRFYLRAGLPFVVFVDADDGGRKILDSFGGWGVPKENGISLADIFSEHSGRDFELEDVLSENFYYQAVKETYPERTIEKPTAENKKRTKAYHELFITKHSFGFSKRRVGETIKRMLLAGRADSETLENLTKLINAVLDPYRKKKS